VVQLKWPPVRFYVVASAYSSLARAEGKAATACFVPDGQRIILPHYGTHYFRLTAGDFADQAAAQPEAQRLRPDHACRLCYVEILIRSRMSVFHSCGTARRLLIQLPMLPPPHQSLQPMFR
jgi:hypothetical protein